MNLEKSIKDVITQKLEDGTVEKLISDELEKGVTNALNNLFRSYGDVTKVIEEKVKSVMVPYLEGYDYSSYLLKLDDVLVEVLKSSALDNKILLENFKGLMIPEERKEIEASELFDIWTDYVSKNVDTSDLEVIFDDGPMYEYVDVQLEVDHEEDRGWGISQSAKLVFECEQDKEMNLEIRLHRWKDERKEGWSISYEKTQNISSLRYLGELDILLMKLDQAGTRLILDTEWESDEIEVEAEPEADFS